jgi:hypothetical protein
VLELVRGPLGDQRALQCDDDETCDDTSIQRVLQVQRSDVMYAAVANSPRTAIGTKRDTLPATMPHGPASASVCVFRSCRRQARRTDAAPMPTNACGSRVHLTVSRGPKRR